MSHRDKQYHRFYKVESAKKDLGGSLGKRDAYIPVRLISLNKFFASTNKNPICFGRIVFPDKLNPCVTRDFHKGNTKLSLVEL